MCARDPRGDRLRVSPLALPGLLGRHVDGDVVDFGEYVTADLAADLVGDNRRGAGRERRGRGDGTRGRLWLPSEAVDRLNAFLLAIDAVRRGGTISLSGVYGGQGDPLPMLTLFDKQIQLRMGQANVKRWTEDIMPLLTGDGDPLGVEDFHTHQLPLEEAPRGYEIVQKKDDGAIKVLLKP